MWWKHVYNENKFMKWMSNEDSHETQVSPKTLGILRLFKFNSISCSGEEFLKIEQICLGLISGVRIQPFKVHTLFMNLFNNSLQFTNLVRALWFSDVVFQTWKNCSCTLFGNNHDLGSCSRCDTIILMISKTL